MEEASMRRSRSVGLGLVAAVVMVAALLAAGAAQSRPSATKVTIAYIPPVLANPAIKAMNDAIAKQAKALGMGFATIGGEYNPQAQIVAMNAAVQKKVNAILIWPLDPKGIQPSFEKAKAAGIPILGIWSPGVANVDMNFQYDDSKGASTIARLVAAELKKQGKDCAVGIIQGIPVVDILRARNEGLEAGAKAAGCTILEKQVNQKDNSDGARPIADAWKTKHGSKMTAILAYNDPSALGAIAATGGSFKPLVSGLNGDELALAAVKNGSLFATAAAPNVEVGAAMAYAAYLKLVKKQTTPKEVWFPFQIITKGNVANYKSWSVRLKGPAQKVSFVKKGGRFVVATVPNYG
jgi:ABC-type sugar transport system substrate-binding protein